MKLRKARKVLRLWYVGHYSHASGTRAARRLNRAGECPPWFAWTFCPSLYAGGGYSRTGGTTR